MIAFIDEQIANAKPMDRAALALVFSEAAAFSGNNHTLAEIDNAPGVFHALPISFWWFPEGAIVTRAHPAYRRLLGARIVSIGGIPVAEAGNRTARFTPGIPAHQHYIATRWLTRVEALKALGLVDADGRARFQFVMPGGGRVEEKLGVAPTADPAAASPPWHASMVPGKGPDPWPHVLDGRKDLPLYLQKPDSLSWTLLNGGDVLYVRSTSLSPYEDNPFEIMSKAYSMVDTVVKLPHLPRAVIVDLRYNEGGNFFNVLTLSTELIRMTAPAGPIYVITGNATNSAAIVFAALLKGGAPDRTTIIGEPISDHEWFWSEGGTVKAPASGLPLRYTDGYHDWANGCTDVHKCYWPVVFHGVKAGSLSPSVPVVLTYADFVRGRDPVLETIERRLQSIEH